MLQVSLLLIIAAKNRLWAIRWPLSFYHIGRAAEVLLGFAYFVEALAAYHLEGKIMS